MQHISNWFYDGNIICTDMEAEWRLFNEYIKYHIVWVCFSL